MPQIRYEFVTTGHGEVLNAIKSVTRAQNQAAKGARGLGGGIGPGAGVSGGAPTAKGYKSDTQMDAYWKASVKAAQNQGRAMQREYEQQYRARERHNAKMAGLEAKEAAKQKAAHDKKIADWRKGQEAFRDAARERAASNRLEWKGAGIKVGRGVLGAGVAGVAGLAGTAIAGGVANIQGAVRSAMALQEAATRTAINARGSGEALVDPATLAREFQSVAVKTPGVTAEEVTDAVQKFVTLTGDLSTGRKAASTFATVASASGSNIGDVAQASASISNQFGLKTDEEIKDVLTALNFQGKQGAFELSDAASQFQRLAAAGAAFGLTGAKGVKTIGGLAQIARTGTGSAEQTTTAIENIFSNLTAKSSLLKKEGVNVFDKKTGKAREVTDVLVDAIAKVGKNDFEKKSAGLRKVFGDQGIRGILPLLNKYQTTFNETQGTEAQKTAAATARLRDEFEKSINAPGTWAEVQQDAATQQATMSSQVAAAQERLKAAAAEQLAPAFLRMVPSLTALTGASASLLPAIESMTRYMGYGVKALQDAGILEGMDTEEKKKVSSVGEAVQRKNEILASGAPTADDAAEIAELDEFIKQGRLKSSSTAELQKQKDALYAKGGVMSPEDIAEVDSLDAAMAKRGTYSTDDMSDAEILRAVSGLQGSENWSMEDARARVSAIKQYNAQDPYANKKMTERDYEDEYVGAAPEGADLDDARLRARMFAGTVQKGGDPSDWFMQGGLTGWATDEESEEQRAMSAKYKENHAEAAGEGPLTTLIAMLVEDMTGVSVASQSATKALQALGSSGQATIAPGVL